MEPLDSDYRESLYQMACALLAAGYSVIPLWGDLRPNTPKAPAIAWAKYQQQHATPAEAKEWFINQGYGGLGIVCGRISGNLAALDPDNAEINDQFAALFPDLLDTHTTLSAGRELPHRRYLAPRDAIARFYGRAGVIELRGEGQYIVCAPTCINGKTYAVVQGGQPLELSAEQWNRLTLWLESFVAPTTEQEPPFELVEQGDSQILQAIFAARVVATGSRGKACFQTACIARDSGWSLESALAAFADAFIECPPLTPHVTETPAQRRREFTSVVKSTYSRQGRKSSALGLPGQLREHLLHHKANALVRVLDCFVMHGIPAGQHFTEAQAVTIGGMYGLSRKAVRAALQATTAEIGMPNSADVGLVKPPPHGAASPSASFPEFLFSCESNFVPKCHSNSGVSQQYSIVTVTNGDKIKRGRKSKYFAMPDVLQIAGVVGITNTLSDPIPFKALAEISDYRAAINRAFIARKPGQHTNKLLAERIGVNRRTIQRTIRRDPSIKVESCARAQPLALDTVEKHIADDRGLMSGYWLEIGGKKFPPMRDVAQRYLQQGLAVALVKREANSYTVKAATITQDVPPPVADELALQKAVGAENDYLPLPTNETIITAEPLAKLARFAEIELGAKTTPIEPRKRPPEQKSGGAS